MMDSIVEGELKHDELKNISSSLADVTNELQACTEVPHTHCKYKKREVVIPGYRTNLWDKCDVLVRGIVKGSLLV